MSLRDDRRYLRKGHLFRAGEVTGDLWQSSFLNVVRRGAREEGSGSKAGEWAGAGAIHSPCVKEKAQDECESSERAQKTRLN